MSATFSTISRPASSLSRLFSTSLSWLRRHYVERAAIAHLYGLEEAALSDIGISRSQIEAAVHGVLGSAKA